MKWLSLSLLLTCSSCATVRPLGVAAVVANEVARRQLARYAEPGSRWPRVDVPLLRWGKWRLSSAFHVSQDKIETDDRHRAASVPRSSTRLKGRIGLDAVYVEIGLRV